MFTNGVFGHNEKERLEGLDDGENEEYDDGGFAQGVSSIHAALGLACGC